MATISERLRDAGDHYGIPIERDTAEAADIIDALMTALERAKPYVEAAVRDDGGIDSCEIGYRLDIEAIDAALSRARGEQP